MRSLLLLIVAADSRFSEVRRLQQEKFELRQQSSATYDSVVHDCMLCLEAYLDPDLVGTDVCGRGSPVPQSAGGTIG